jgi:hypothetical protein
MEPTIIPIDAPSILPKSGIEQIKRENAYETVVEHLKRYNLYLWRKEHYALFMSIKIRLISEMGINVSYISA